MPERDPYPTAQELDTLRHWDINDPKGWLEYAQSLWEYRDWGWPDLEGIVSTAGWSGNEEIIAVMQEAQHGLLWHQVWQMTKRGGHYMLKLPAPHPDDRKDQ